MPALPPPPPLFATDNGSVRRCPCCGELEVTFGGVGLSLPDRALRQLRTTVRGVARAGESRCWGWYLRVETTRQHVALPLQRGDAARLLELLDGAVAMLALSELLEAALGYPLPEAAAP